MKRFALGTGFGWYLSLSAAACSEASLSEPQRFEAATRCADDLVAEAARAGDSGAAWLLFPCEGNTCTGDERFARGLRHTVQIEAEAPEEAVLLISSDDPTIAAVFDVVSAFDPCAGKLKAWATLEARTSGETHLAVRDANGDIDTIPIGVSEPAQIRLRATPSESFAYRGPVSTLEALEGESWLLFPELFDAQGVLLIGLPQLTWSIEDPRIAELRSPEPHDAPEKAATTGATAEIKAKRSGETALEVRTAGGAAARLWLRVTAP